VRSEKLHSNGFFRTFGAPARPLLPTHRLDLVYFRQDVLTKYEVASGFEVKDDGPASNSGYWGLTRSTSRIGNELLATAIGDFAEGVPLEEWQHWRQYAVEPPSADSARAFRQELPIPEAVNSLVRALNRLNAVFAEMAASFGTTITDPLWRGSLDSLAGRQLKMGLSCDGR
jgi:hypothetical protein